ncbi:hypothetical protein ASF74_00910 [Arthrobacter sp. Leaf145]|nr:hypothetical protein ASF74_00910 [Arthrobacter sp. Leaf145]
MRAKLGTLAVGTLCLVIVAIAVVTSLLAVAVVVGLVAIIVIWTLKPKLTAPAIAIVGMLFVRPNIWGELYTNIGLGLFLLAAIIALIQDGGRLTFVGNEYRPLRSPLFWTALAYLWLLLRASFQGLDTVAQSLGGYASMAVCILAVLLIVGDRDRRDFLVKGFIVAVIAVSGSYAVTVALWVIIGVGNGSLGTMLVGSWPDPQPVYFPFTTTVATQPIFGLAVPRFVGFGREPGWMAMYGAVAFFLLPLVGWRNKFVKVIIVVAILGTVSTAGFGVLIICIALQFAFGHRSKTTLGRFIRACLGLALIAGAIWAAFYAPVLGFGAKGEQNGISLSERSAATNAGIWALFNDPISGGTAAQKVGAVNLVAAVAAYGVPFSVAMALAVCAPMLSHPNRYRLMPISAALFSTLLMSQPALDSTWVFALASLAAAAALESPGSRTNQDLRPNALLRIPPAPFAKL